MTRPGLALFLGASALFANMYSTQAILPDVERGLSASPAAAGLTIPAGAARDGRVGTAVVADWTSWRVGLEALTVPTIAGALAMHIWLPRDEPPRRGPPARPSR